MLERLVRAAHEVQGNAEVPVRLGELGPTLEHPAQAGDRVHAVPALDQQRCEVVPRC